MPLRALSTSACTSRVDSSIYSRREFDFQHSNLAHFQRCFMSIPFLDCACPCRKRGRARAACLATSLCLLSLILLAQPPESQAQMNNSRLKTLDTRKALSTNKRCSACGVFPHPLLPQLSIPCQAILCNQKSCPALTQTRDDVIDTDSSSTVGRRLISLPLFRLQADAKSKLFTLSSSSPCFTTFIACGGF